MNATQDDEKSQLDAFKETACELETDDDERYFKDRLGKLVKHKPAPDRPESK